MGHKSQSQLAAVSSGDAPSEPLQRLIHEAIQATPDGIGIFDPQDHLVFCNAALAALFGMSLQQAQGQSFEAIIRHAYSSKRGMRIESDDIDKWLVYAFERRRSRPYRSFQVDLLDGRWVQLTEQLTDDGHMFIFFTDITEQKRVECQLQQLTRELQVAADTDALTGIANRRCFFRCAERELQRCRRKRDSIALLLVDIDHFKQVNDRYGHQQGDEVLRRVCQVLGRGLRDYDVLGRIGGEEFALLVPQVDAQAAEAVAERLCSEVEAMAFEPPCQGLTVSLSIGITLCQEANASLNQLIHEADTALYRAKFGGRNRIEWAEPLS